MSESFERTEFCISPTDLFRVATGGWKPELQQKGHPPDCECCRVDMKGMFRFVGDNLAPSFLEDTDNSQRPLWLQRAIQDFMGPTVVKRSNPATVTCITTGRAKMADKAEPK